MNKRQEVISQALRQRLRSLELRVQGIRAEDFGEFASFANAAFLTVEQHQQQNIRGEERPCAWMNTDVDCLVALRQLSCGKQIKTFPSQPPAVVFLERLSAVKNEPKERFNLLTARFANPLNFVLSSESATREHLLQRLMVQDRTRIELRSLNEIDSDDLLLKLNLIAVNAIYDSDLRFLDALNYYYELLPSLWHPNAQHPWLLISYLALYAQALKSSLRVYND